MINVIPTIYLILILAIAGLLSLLSLGVVLWSSKWPKTKISITELIIHEHEFKGKRKYSANIKYQYSYKGIDYFSSRFSLLGSRLFDSEDEIQSALLSNESYVCPISPDVSFVYFESRLASSLAVCFLLSLLVVLALYWL